MGQKGDNSVDEGYKPNDNYESQYGKGSTRWKKDPETGQNIELAHLSGDPSDDHFTGQFREGKVGGIGVNQATIVPQFTDKGEFEHAGRGVGSSKKLQGNTQGRGQAPGRNTIPNKPKKGRG